MLEGRVWYLHEDGDTDENNDCDSERNSSALLEL
jgi:hypothetical protein